MATKTVSKRKSLDKKKTTAGKNEVSPQAKELAEKISQLRPRWVAVVGDMVDGMLKAGDPSGSYVPFSFLSEDEAEAIIDVSNSIEELTKYMDGESPSATLAVLDREMSRINNTLHDRFMDHLSSETIEHDRELADAK